MGLWQGSYQQQEQELLWLRWWNPAGNLLLIGNELAERERQRAQQEKQHAEQEKRQAEQAKCQVEQAKRQIEQAKRQVEQAKEVQQQEALARREAIPRLLGLGLNIEQVAEILGLAIEEVKRWKRD